MAARREGFVTESESFPYSDRKATNGETREARRAGSQLASTAETMRIRETPAITAGSVPETPYS